MAPLRILSSLTYYAPHISGLTVYARRLMGGLAAKGHTATIVTSQYDRKLPKREMIEGVRVVRTRAWMKVSKGILIPFYPFRLAQQIHGHDVLLLHLPQLEACLAAIYARLVARRPVVTVCHCDIDLPPGPIRTIFMPVIRASHFITGLLSNVIVVNSAEYADSSRYLRRFARKIVVSPPPCVIEPPRGGTPSEVRGAPVIGFVGRFAVEKGISYLLEAMSEILKRAPGAQVVFVGEWKHVLGEQVYAKVRDRIDSLQGHVALVGVVPDGELAAYYRSFDVLALPSINSTESFGMVQVEAMLAGTPVVASDLPGVRAPIEATGMGELVPPRDPPSLAEAILRVARDRRRYTRNRADIERLFGLERAVNFYEQLLSAHAGVPAPARQASSLTGPEPQE